MGHDIFLLDIDALVESKRLKCMSKQAKELISNELPVIFEREHNKKPFDLFFSYLHNSLIIPDVLSEIKRKVFTVNYTTNFHQFEVFREIGSIVDCNIYVTKQAKESFENLGKKSYWMPFASNPSFYKTSIKKEENAVFIGSVYGSRSLLFWRLLQLGINLQIYGNGWKNDLGKNKKLKVTSLKNVVNEMILEITGKRLTKGLYLANEELEFKVRNSYNKLNNNILSLLRQDYQEYLHDPLSDYDYVKIISEAGIVINIAESRFNHDFINPNVLYCSNLRDFEATMSGSLLCTQYSNEIAELFEIDKEIICYHNEHDLAEKVKYFSKNVAQRDNIAKAGYERCLRSHTWQKRFSDFFTFLQS